MAKSKFPVNLTEEQHQALVNLKIITGNSMNSILRTALDEYILKMKSRIESESEKSS